MEWNGIELNERNDLRMYKEQNGLGAKGESNKKKIEIIKN